MTISKKKGTKTPQMIEDDIRYGFNKIMSQKRPIYFLTISNTLFKEPKHLQFLVKSFFNKIRKDYRYTYEKTNYLSIVEYPEKVSRGNLVPDDCMVHTHIIVETDLLPDTIEYYANMTFNNNRVLKSLNGWYDLRKVSDRNDKDTLLNYLLKQKDLFDDCSYDYKIN